MKKVLLVLAIALTAITNVTAQNSLTVSTNVHTSKGGKANLTLTAIETSVSWVSGSEYITTLTIKITDADGVVDVLNSDLPTTYIKTFTSYPTKSDIVAAFKAYLEAKGLTIL